MKSYLKSVVALTVICAVVALLMAGTNQFTAPLVEENARIAAEQALLEVMPDGGEFTPADPAGLPESVLEAYTASNGGNVFKLTASGYGPDMIIMCGVNAEGAVTGAVCLSSNETLGKEKKYGETTVGATAATIDGVETITGATMTTKNYRNAVKDALSAAAILGGKN